MKKTPSTNLEKLTAEWYERLKDEGFEDIEADETRLKKWSSQFSAKKSLDSWQAKEEYYRLAVYFLNEFRFRYKQDRTIWMYHSEGLSARDIAKILIGLGVKTNRTTVWAVIKRLQKNMKKKYRVTT